MIQADLVIIGGGPAGMSAAMEGAHYNLAVVLLEDNSGLGGKVLKNDTRSLHYVEGEKAEREQRSRLHKSFTKIADKIITYTNCEVWSVNSEKVVEFYSRSSSKILAGAVQGKKIIIANGAVDRISPFPGWHLPGVFTIGGLNTLVKRGVLPGKRIVVSGAGPLQMALLNYLIKAGAHTVAAVTPNSFFDMIPTAWGLIAGRDIKRLALGMRYLLKIKNASVPLHYSHIVTEVIGNERVEKAIISRVDSDWSPISGMEREVEADIVATGYNLLPITDLARLIGCETQYNEQNGHLIVTHATTMETSKEGIFIAGDGATVKGYQAAVDEGRIAAIEVAKQLGKFSDRVTRKWVDPTQKRIGRARRIGSAMCKAFNPKPGLLNTVTDETIICRCEEVTYKDIKTAVDQGARDLNDLKRRTRLGMGNCQGTFCCQVANELMWKAAGNTWPRTWFTVRQPVRPVPIGVLAAHTRCKEEIIP